MSSKTPKLTKSSSSKSLNEGMSNNNTSSKKKKKLSISVSNNDLDYLNLSPTTPNISLKIKNTIPPLSLPLNTPNNESKSASCSARSILSPSLALPSFNCLTTPTNDASLSSNILSPKPLETARLPIDKSSNIKVICRFRPPNNEELSRSDSMCVKFIDESAIEIVETGFNQLYAFDKIFGANSMQEQIYECIGKDIVNGM